MPGTGMEEQYELGTFIGRNRTFWINPPALCMVRPEFVMKKHEVKEDGGKTHIEERKMLKQWVCEVVGTKVRATDPKSSIMAKLALNDVLADLYNSKGKTKWPDLKAAIKRATV